VYLLLRVEFNFNSTNFCPKSKERGWCICICVLLLTPASSVRLEYIGALTKPKPAVAAKVEASSSGSSSGMALAFAPNTAPAFIAAWDAAADDIARQALEQNALQHGTTAVRVEALMKRDARAQANMATLQAAMTTATAAVATANANAAAAQAVATAATHNVFRPAALPKFENTDKDMDVRK
jgi:hypothetical protein